MNLDGEKQDVRISGTSNIGPDGQVGEFTVRENGQEGTLELHEVDGEQYVGSGQEWEHLGEEILTRPLLDPQDVLGFAKESDDVEDKGSFTIRGRKTSHIRAELNLATAAEKVRLDRLATALAQDRARAEGVDTSADLYIDDATKQLVRMRIVLEDEGDEITNSADILKWDVEVDPKIPPEFAGG